LPIITNSTKVNTMWIFGYGSLIWRPGFDFIDHRDGYLEGWTRKFYQGSTDHRGVPGAPGRVATLLRAPEARVWGRVYKVLGAQADAILAQLDHREKGGYQRHQVDVICRSGVCVPEALVYVATQENAEWEGPASAEEIARQIQRSSGPSGANADYLLELAASLRQMEAEDPHVFAIERALVALNGGAKR
jgi:cation transport regulator ChaC